MKKNNFNLSLRIKLGFPGDSVVKNLPANAGAAVDGGLILELRRSPGGENGKLFQYSSPENFMRGGPGLQDKDYRGLQSMGSQRVGHDCAIIKLL